MAGPQYIDVTYPFKKGEGTRTLRKDEDGSVYDTKNKTTHKTLDEWKKSIGITGEVRIKKANVPAEAEKIGIPELRKWAKPIMEYYETLGTANCAGFAFAVCNKLLELEGRVNTEVKNLRNAWRIRQNLSTKEFAKYFSKKELFAVEEGQEPQRFVSKKDGALVYTPLEAAQAERVWNEMKNAKAGTMLTVLYARTATGEGDGREENDPSHVLTCIGNGKWVDEIECRMNVYDLKTKDGFLEFNNKFKFVENSMLFSLKAEQFPLASKEAVVITADSLGVGAGKESVSPVEFAAEIRTRTGMQFEYVFAEMLNQNKIAGDQTAIRREEAKVKLRMPQNWKPRSPLIAQADMLLERISGQ